MWEGVRGRRGSVVAGTERGGTGVVGIGVSGAETRTGKWSGGAGKRGGDVQERSGNGWGQRRSEDIGGVKWNSGLRGGNDRSSGCGGAVTAGVLISWSIEPLRRWAC